MTMKFQRTYVCEDNNDQCSTSDTAPAQEEKQPSKLLELYVFIDPLCPECWALEPAIKKLKMEYGQYLTINTALVNELESLNSPCGSKYRSLVKEMAKSYHETACRTGMPCDGDVWYENAMTTPYEAILAIKAAELQGKVIGSKYLRRVREALFLHKENIASQHTLINCAIRVRGMDVDEFVKDMHSDTTKKALSEDKKMAEEMDVSSAPTLVFFGENVDEPGLKVEGAYSYNVYEEVINDMAQMKLEKGSPLPLENFVSIYSLVATKEIAVVYDLTYEEAHREMRKLQLQQQVEEISTKHGSIWRSLT